MTGTRKDVQAALEALEYEVLGGKGGFWLKGQGWISLAKARRMTGLAAPRRITRDRALPWGEYATIAAISGRLNG